MCVLVVLCVLVCVYWFVCGGGWGGGGMGGLVAQLCEALRKMSIGDVL